LKISVEILVVGLDLVFGLSGCNNFTAYSTASASTA